MIGGIIFTQKAASAMKEQFDYNFHHFPKSQQAVFRATCKDVRANGGTELDAACVFMAKIADSIFKPKEHAEMITIWMEKMRELTPQLSARYADELDKTYGDVMEKVA